MPRRLSPNFWIAPVAGATFFALYAIDHLSSRQVEPRPVEQGSQPSDCREPSSSEPKAEGRAQPCADEGRSPEG